jgi:DNA-directed RNA polymerase alpha subunit
MTNKEIKLELAKVALTKCNFTTSETLTEALKNLYDWIVEEPEVEVKTIDKNSFDSVDIKEVLNIVRKNQDSSSGIATLLGTAFHKNNINTVGDLTRIGRRDFSKYRLVGKKSVWAIDDALDELGVKSW